MSHISISSSGVVVVWSSIVVVSNTAVITGVVVTIDWNLSGLSSMKSSRIPTIHTVSVVVLAGVVSRLVMSGFGVLSDSLENSCEEEKNDLNYTKDEGTERQFAGTRSS